MWPLLLHRYTCFAGHSFTTRFAWAGRIWWKRHERCSWAALNEDRF